MGMAQNYQPHGWLAIKNDDVWYHVYGTTILSAEKGTDRTKMLDILIQHVHIPVINQRADIGPTL